MSITPDGIETHRESLSIGSLPHPGFPDDGFDLPDAIDDAPGFVRFATVGRIVPPIRSWTRTGPIETTPRVRRNGTGSPRGSTAASSSTTDRVQRQPRLVSAEGAESERGAPAGGDHGTAGRDGVPPTVGISQQVGQWGFTRRYTPPDGGLEGMTDDGPVVFSVGEGDAHPSLPHVVSFDPASGGSV